MSEPANPADSFLVAGARVIDPAAKSDAVMDVLAIGGVLQAAGSSVPPGVRRIDGRGMLLTPGWWDLHVHFRDPGTPEAETLESGSRAAAAGGFTHVVTMPNTAPACDTPELLRRQQDPALPVRILPAAAVTAGRGGRQLADLERLAEAGAAAFSDDGTMVADPVLMAKALRRARALGRAVMDHAVLPSRAGAGVIRDCETARRLGLPVFPPEAEVEAVAQDVQLCRETGGAVHIQHVSCAGSVAHLRAARAEGLSVTAEAAPHHLAIAADEITGDDGNYRMNPPLGSRDDVRALRAAVCDGTIAAFATDHAPHAPASKSRGFMRAPSGVIGLETAAGVTFRVMVQQEAMSLNAWVKAWTTGPASILGLPPPALRVGQPADLVLLDLATPWQVDPARFQSRSRNCPFAGWTLHARPVLTVCEGRVTWSA